VGPDRASPPLSVETFETLEAVDALAAEWAALEAATPEATGFQSFLWCRLWLGVWPRAGRRRARIVAVRESGVLVMLWPLQIEQRFGVSLARWLGEPMTQYGDALALPGAGRTRWRAAAEAEFSRWRDVDLFAFTRLRADGALVRSGFAAREGGEALAAPFVALSVDAPLARRRHKSLERRMRRLANYGAPVFEEIVDPAERLQAVRAALALKRQWLREKGRFSAGLGAAAATRFIEELAASGFLRVHCLRIGETIAAIDLGFVAGGAFRSFLGAFDERFAAGSPGLALLPLLMERCAREGLQRFDFLPPADPYKQLWARDATPLGVRYAPVTLRGRAAAFAFDSLRPLIKQFLAATASTNLLPARGEKVARRAG
jgi:CelD/BcsL family acetyltransferase involved in cellulose biosynthesis